MAKEIVLGSSTTIPSSPCGLRMTQMNDSGGSDILSSSMDMDSTVDIVSRVPVVSKVTVCTSDMKSARSVQTNL